MKKGLLTPEINFCAKRKKGWKVKMSDVHDLGAWVGIRRVVRGAAGLGERVERGQTCREWSEPLEFTSLFQAVCWRRDIGPVFSMGSGK